MARSINDDRCHQCDKSIPANQVISTEMDGKEVLLCGPCWNGYVSKYMGSDFETIELNPITLRDCEENPHEFHFFTHLVPSGLAIDAREMIGEKQTGYSFSVLGPHGRSQEDLLLDLYEKIKRGLSKKYLKNISGRMEIGDNRAVGRIEYDKQLEGKTPKIMIDGRPVTWAEFGGLLMTFEGWQFRLDILDPSEEV